MSRHRLESSPLRGDIQGLRALAVLAVLLWHAEVPGLPGGFVGVDVFFVISGFLITRMLADQVRATGRVALLDFYARRARRLLPAACLVLLCALAATYLLLPPIRWSDTAKDVLAATFSVLNWRLADQTTDYLAQGAAPSIVQHYWSLSVEEQFYLVWPVLLIAVVALWRRRGRDPRGALLLTVLTVAAVSFGYAVWASTHNPEASFFVTTTRAWELAVGCAVALALPRLARLPRSAAVALGWAGIAAILGAACWLSPTTPFPGTAALLPTLGAAAVIVGGVHAGRSGPAIVLDTAPGRAIGALSYSLYLWHWPLLVIAEARFGQLSPASAAAVVAASAVPAWASYHLVENPFRHALRFRGMPLATLRSGGLAITATAVVALVFLQMVAWPANRTAPVANAAGGTVAGATPPLGAAVLAANPLGDQRGAPADHVAGLRPAPAAVRADVPASYARGCHQQETGDAALACRYGPDDGTVRIALVGDSHATQWVPAFEELAPVNKWTVTTYTKSSCPFAAVTVAQGTTRRAYESCDRWNRAVHAALTGPERPDLVVVTSSDYQIMSGGAVLPAAQGRAAFVRGLREGWQQLVAAGLQVVALRDTPHPGLDLADCVSAHTDQLTSCAYPKEPSLAGAGAAQEEAAQGLPGVRFVDLTDAICPTTSCAAVIGQVVVFRDSNHLTATYARTLAPRLGTALAPLLKGGA